MTTQSFARGNPLLLYAAEGFGIPSLAASLACQFTKEHCHARYFDRVFSAFFGD